MIKESKFPIDWTSTQLEGAVPSLSNAIGYDVPLSSRFVSRGAPKFVFNSNEMSIKFDMTVEVWAKDYSQKYLDINMNGLFIKFKMQLTKDLQLLVDWESIQMDSADVTSKVELDTGLDNEVVAGYFNFVFEEIVPWVNEYHPASVTSF